MKCGQYIRGNDEKEVSMTENVTGVFGFNGHSMTAPWIRICSSNGEDTIRIMGSAAEWHDLMDQISRYYHPHPPVYDTDIMWVEMNNDMIRIDDISEVQIGDLVHVKGVREPMECLIIRSNWSGDANSAGLYDSRFAVGISWACNANWVWVKNTMFDYAERPKPTPTLPSFPDDDYSFHFFIGADGTKVLYNRFDKNDDHLWRMEGQYTGDSMWLSDEQLIADHQEVLPLTEVGVEACNE